MSQIVENMAEFCSDYKVSSVFSTQCIDIVYCHCKGVHILFIATVHVYSKRALHVDTVRALLSTYTTIVTCIAVTCVTVTCASLSAVSRTVYIVIVFISV